MSKDSDFGPIFEPQGYSELYLPLTRGLSNINFGSDISGNRLIIPNSQSYDDSIKEILTKSA